MIFISLKVLLVKVTCSNAFSIFLIATMLFWSSDKVSRAETTDPYAPDPTNVKICDLRGSTISKRFSTSNLVPSTRKVLYSFSAGSSLISSFSRL